MREEYKKLDSVSYFHIKKCPFCGSPAELWEHQLANGTYRKVVMCSNGGDGLDDEGCPMYMPPDGFYQATKLAAIDIWNNRSET